MNKSSILAALAAAVTLTAGSAFAENEKCNVAEKGMVMVKAGKADCKVVLPAGVTCKAHSCAGQNVQGDKQSWIFVPEGQCDKVKMGDLSGLSDDVATKLEKVSMDKTMNEK